MIKDDKNIIKKYNYLKILRIFILLVSFVVIIAGTIVIFKLIDDKNNPRDQNTVKSNEEKNVAKIKSDADSLKEQALQAEKNNEDEKAKLLLQQAQDKYKAINDDEGVADTDSQLYLINNQPDPKPKDIITIGADQ